MTNATPTATPLEQVEQHLANIQRLASDGCGCPQPIHDYASAALRIIRGLPVPTAGQARVLAFIRKHLAANGEIPTYREMATGLNYASTSAPHRLVGQLVKRGLLRHGRRETARSLMLVGGND